MRIPSFILLCLLAMLAWCRPVHAAQSYDNCTGFITSVPAVISTQGTWCLKQDLATAITSGFAITIATNNVTLDCNDFKLGGQGAGLGTRTIGIFAQDRLNATVRHCNIRGFEAGLYLQVGVGTSGGHTVEDNRFDGNTAFGMSVQGDGSVVRRNGVFDTGGSSVIIGAVGITTYGSVDILDNTVSAVLASSGSNGSVYGILATNSSARVIGNGVRGLLKDGSGVTYGIFNNNNTGRITLRNNDLVGDASAGSVGLNCIGANNSARDNTLSGFASAIVLCSDDGGNVVHP